MKVGSISRFWIEFQAQPKRRETGQSKYIILDPDKEKDFINY